MTGDGLAPFRLQPHCVCRREWQVGDLVFWDKTHTMHRVATTPPIAVP
jgi:alpha-ketoglutarate-dependent taurine dioxygenase